MSPVDDPAVGRPVVIVVNARFIANGPSVIPYGAAGFVRTVIRSLRRRHPVALLLYRRTDALFSPILHNRYHDGIRTCEVLFDFDAPTERIQQAFGEAVRALAEGHPGGPPVLYHQSVVTLPFTPDRVDCLVTCHAPFVDSVLDVIGSRLTWQSFEDKDGKVVALRRRQRIGLEWLRSNPTALCVELAALQRNQLLRYGVSAAQCLTAPPPVAEDTNWPSGVLSLASQRWLSCAGNRLLLFSAAARIDGFKNLEALVDATVRLYRGGLKPMLYLAAGRPTDEAQRQELLAAVPRDLRGFVIVEPRLTPAQLHTLFRLSAGRSVFAFPSRYETLGLTPLQALSHHVDVAVPDDPDRIGAAEYTPFKFRYQNLEDGLAKKVAELSFRDSRGRAEGHEELLPRGAFVTVLEQVISHGSTS